MTVDEYEFRTELIALEIETCKYLASNDVKMRKKGLRRLRAFLSSDHIGRSGIEDFGRIWIGLFNYVWMSDTPLVQEADVDEISNLIHRIRNFDAVLFFVRGFFTTITSQWNRISHYRTDKFLMFIRRFLRQIFFLLQNADWNSEKIVKLGSELYSAIQIFPIELTQHLNDIFTEELAKVSEGSVPTDALILLLKCFVDCILQQKPSKAVVNHINANIFCSLVRQVKLLIKQKAAVEFDPEAFSLEEPEPECSSNFDPRPGNAHVFLPYIDFDEKKIVEYLEESISSAGVSQKVKNIITQNIQMFKSVTRLRQSICQPAKILHEVNDKERKRKRKPEKFSSLIKKACKKLDDENDDFSTKKMKKLLRSSTWKVTKNVDTDTKKTVIQDWTVSDLRKKGPVSFSEETNSLTYEVDSSRRPKRSSVPITVPRSACDDRPGILIPEENYAIVDFSNLENDSKCIEKADSIPKKNEKKRKTKSISPRKTRSGRVYNSSAIHSEKTAYIEPPWTNTQFGESDSVEVRSRVKNIKMHETSDWDLNPQSPASEVPTKSDSLRRSKRGKSISLEIPEKNDEVKSSKRRKYGSTKNVKVTEKVEPYVQEGSSSMEFSVKNEKTKPSRRRKSNVVEFQTFETSDEIEPTKQKRSHSKEILDKNEKTKRIKKSISPKYEPRKTRSGRTYNVR